MLQLDKIKIRCHNESEINIVEERECDCGYPNIFKEQIIDSVDQSVTSLKKHAYLVNNKDESVISSMKDIHVQVECQPEIIDKMLWL